MIVENKLETVKNSELKGGQIWSGGYSEKQESLYISMGTGPSIRLYNLETLILWSHSSTFGEYEANFKFVTDQVKLIIG